MAEIFSPVTTSNLANQASITAAIDANFAAVATLLLDILSRSGVSPNSMNANLDMNSNAILNLPAPVAVNSPARLIDVTSNPTIQVPPVGTSGATVGLLNANKTDSGNNTFSGANTFSGVQTFTNVGNIGAFKYVTSPMFGVTLEQYGGAADGVTDNAPALAALIAANNTGSFCIQLGHGTYLFSSSTSFTQHVTSSFSAIGQGPDVTILKFASGAGLSITLQDYYSSVTFDKLSFTTMGAGTATAVTLTQTGTTTSPALAALSSFNNVTFRGSDGYVVTNYWLTSVNISGVSNVFFTNVSISGSLPVNPAVYTVVGTGVTIAGTSTNPPVSFCFENCMFNYIGTGINYGAKTQGVICSNTQFTGGNIGINVPASIDSLDEMTIVNCQFNVLGTGIITQTGCPSLSIIGSLFIIPTNSSAGIIMNPAEVYSISGCFFESNVVGNGNGVVVQAAINNFGGSITGCTFTNLSSGVWFQNAVNYFSVVSGCTFRGCTQAINDSSLDVQAYGNYGFNPVGPISVTPSVAPTWTYNSGISPETLYMSAGSGISALTVSGQSMLPVAAGNNVQITVQLPPRQQMVVTFAGTLTAKKYVH